MLDQVLAPETVPSPLPKPRGLFWRVVRDAGAVWLPGTILLLLVLAALAGDRLTLADPEYNDLGRQFQPPVFAGGEWDRPLGTDYFGRDIYSRMVVGARLALIVAVVSVLVAGSVGTALGLIAGYSRNWLVDALISRVADLTLAFPILLLGLILALQRGPTFTNIIIVLSVFLWSRFTKIVRGEVLSLRTKDFVALAVVSGASTTWILRKHLLPNVLNSVIVVSTVQLGGAVLAEASLSFLGAGVPPPDPAWGSMVAEGRDFMREAWWVSVMPGVAILLTVLSFNLFGDWLRDRLDPKLRQL
jgi:peptide/nickel transport system permease protein